MASRTTPVATYRLQFNRQFTFRDAAALVDYLDDLGITDLYASPLLTARPGSTHGYDVVDPTRVNPELGTEEELRELAERLAERGMGLILDVVPNHMAAVAPDNRWWTDVLEHGASSPYARYFDIDFHPAKIDLAEKILLPILGDPFGRILENQEVVVLCENGTFVARYGSHRLPLAIRTWPRILRSVAARLEARDADRRTLESLRQILRAVERLPVPERRESPVRLRHLRVKELARSRIDAMTRSGNGFAQALEDTLADLNGRRGDPRSFDSLEALLEEQPYRLSFWRVAADEINYRRFFDINELVAIQIEEPAVFASVHETVFRLIRERLVTGLRVDHVDGLSNPRRYLQDLDRGCREASGAAGGRPLYVVVEKILGPREKLDPAWPVDGTTGYDFLNKVNGLFVDPAGLEELRAIWESFTGHHEAPSDTVYGCKKLILLTSMPGELHVLALRLDRISERHRSSRDFTLNSLQRALAEVIACFPVYRTYISGPGEPIRQQDFDSIRRAISLAKNRNRAISASVFDFIEGVLLLRLPVGGSEADLQERYEFVRRFQQITGPVMAKGVEDTAFYRRFPLASLCEVGADLDHPAVSVDEFHRFNRERLASSPRSLSATSTHDTKRGEDVRARLNVLSEIPDAWRRTLEEWNALNAPLRERLEGHDVPERNGEYFLYQTLLGSCPLEQAGSSTFPAWGRRLEEYAEKAMREAKVHTSWISPNVPHEEAVRRFLRALLSPAHAFLPSLTRFVAALAPAAQGNSLSQTLLKVASPGIPDIYQGAEFIDLRLADPDNRRPVDFESRRRALRTAGARDDSADRLKLFVLRESLRFRRSRAELFASGAYVPLRVEGPARDRVIAFLRGSPDDPVIALAGRFFSRASGWAGTRILLDASPGPSRYRDLFTGAELAVHDGTIEAADAFSSLPVALLSPAPP